MAKLSPAVRAQAALRPLVAFAVAGDLTSERRAAICEPIGIMLRQMNDSNDARGAPCINELQFYLRPSGIFYPDLAYRIVSRAPPDFRGDMADLIVALAKLVIPQNTR